MPALGFASLLVFGILLVLVGANQGDLGRALGLALSGSGLLGSSLALGIGAGVVVAGPLFDRYPRRPLFTAAALLAGAALLLFDREQGSARTVQLLFAAGFGGGAYLTVLNAALLERFGERATRPLAAVHAGATLGAMLGPPLVGWIAARYDFALSFHAVGLAHLLVAACGTFVSFGAPAAARAEPGPERPSSAAVRARALLPVALILFAYVGVETGLAIFALPYADAAGLPESRGRLAISAFWCGLLLCRVALALLPRVSEARLLVAAGAAGGAALAGGVALDVVQIEPWFALVGLALGPVYPLAIALAGQRFPRARGTAAGLVTGAGSLGGFALPWLVGAVGDRLGVSAALASLALATLLVAAAAVPLAARAAPPRV